MAYLFSLAMFCITFIILLRTILIISGNLKDPILRHFEHYGPNEIFYQPLPAFLSAFGAFLLSLGDLFNAIVVVMPIGLILWFVSYNIWSNPEFSAKYSRIMLRYPLWLHEIKQRTGREERRRMAYMWLRLPRRLRNTYNSNDHAFREWADFIILGTFRKAL